MSDKREIIAGLLHLITCTKSHNVDLEDRCTWYEEDQHEDVWERESHANFLFAADRLIDIVGGNDEMALKTTMSLYSIASKVEFIASKYPGIHAIVQKIVDKALRST